MDIIVIAGGGGGGGDIAKSTYYVIIRRKSTWNYPQIPCQEKRVEKNRLGPKKVQGKDNDLDR